jgi:hypothetical protein
MDATGKRSVAKNITKEHWRNLAKNIVWGEETKLTMGARVRLLYAPSNALFFIFVCLCTTKTIVWKIYIFLFTPLKMSSTPQKKFLGKKNIGEVFGPASYIPLSYTYSPNKYRRHYVRNKAYTVLLNINYLKLSLNYACIYHEL